jgi:uncharacterized protein YqgV (UPF0045/DUF77 family)
MCEVREEVRVSCQLSFITLGYGDYNRHIQDAINIIEKSNLDYTVGPMSTIVKGDLSKVMNLINTVCNVMRDKEYIINMAISNICGCDRLGKSASGCPVANSREKEESQRPSPRW